MASFLGVVCSTVPFVAGSCWSFAQLLKSGRGMHPPCQNDPVKINFRAMPENRPVARWPELIGQPSIL